MNKLVSILTMATLLLTVMLSIDLLYAQPTWSFRVKVLPAELYIGEWGNVYINITNIDCESRRDYILMFDDAREDYINRVVERAEKMVSESFIEDYRLEVEGMWGSGGEIYGDYTLNLYSVCVGRPIEIVRIGLWYPFKGIARAMTFWNDTRFTLQAFNPVEYIALGRDVESSKKLEFKVYIPEDIPSEEASLKPAVDIRVNYPGWLEYTLESYSIEENDAEIKPYRSFNLTVTDHDGLNPIPKARVVIRRLVYYYDVREYVTPENGTLRIIRLPDDKFQVEVYWNSSFKQLYPHIHAEQHSAYELARDKILKTSIFNPLIRVRDVHGRLLDGAIVSLDGVNETAVNGRARFMLVGQENHTIQVYWRGFKVYDGWVWVGYHPTIYPWMTRPAVEHNITVSVGDLLVQAVDSGGRPVGAFFNVSGPLSFEKIYSRSGLLNITMLPIQEYYVKALNISDIFNSRAGAVGVFKPGILEKLTLPIHSVTIKVLTDSGRPVEDANVSLGKALAETDDRGLALFSGVPEGNYTLTVEWLGVEVYRGSLKVHGSIEETVKARIYDIGLTILDSSGERVKASYEFIDPAGRTFSSLNVDAISLKDIPDGSSRLRITYEGRTLYDKEVPVSELSKTGEVKLPIADIKVMVKWVDGKPLEKARIDILDSKSGSKYRVFTDGSGATLVKDRPFSEYKILVYYPYSDLLVASRELYFTGQETVFTLEKTDVKIRVLDSLGNPVSSATVSLSYIGVPIARQATDHDGYAYFKGILKLPVYDFTVSGGGSSVRGTCYPDSTTEARLPYISFLGVPVYVPEMWGLAYIIMPIAIIIAIIFIVWRFFGKLSREEVEYE